MMRKLLMLGVFGAVALLLAAGAQGARKPAEPVPDLNGRWAFNDDVTARMMQGMRDEGRPRFGPGGGPGDSRPGGGPPSGGGGRRGGGRMRPDPGGPGGMERQGGPSMQDMEEITILQKDGSVSITDGGGRTRIYWPDSRKVKIDRPGDPGGAETIRSSWKDGSLVVTVKPAKGPDRTESWTITNDGKRLFLSLSMDGGGWSSRPMRRAYDRVPEDEGRRPRGQAFRGSPQGRITTLSASLRIMLRSAISSSSSGRSAESSASGWSAPPASRSSARWNVAGR